MEHVCAAVSFLATSGGVSGPFPRQTPVGIRRTERPRSFKELFEVVEGNFRLREEHRWERRLEDQPDEGQVFEQIQASRWKVGGVMGFK